MVLGIYLCVNHEGNEALQNAIDQEIAMYPLPRDSLDDAAETLSGCMRRILAIERGTTACPSLMPLNEP